MSNALLTNSDGKRAILACLLACFVSFGTADATVVSETKIVSQNQHETIAVKGTVLDDLGEPLIGVSVQVKGSKIGTITDLDGHFTIETDKNSVLVISYIGMHTQEISVSGRQEISVKMSYDSTLLSDVVVIGYGKQSKAALTSAISKVNSKDLATVPAGNPMAMLQGKVPGMEIRVNSGQPGADPTIIVRGGTTTSPEKDAPMVIVDGVIRSLKDINYSDIESIQVLKDAASTAIYGSKASRGIIMVTTKQGTKGKGSVTVSYGLTIDHQPARMPLSNAREYLTATRGAALHAQNPDVYLNGGFAMSTAHKRNALCTTAYLDDYISNYGEEYVEDLLLNKGWETMDDPANPGKKLIFKDTDFQDNLFRSPVNHDLNVTFSGGTDKATYYTSVGYLTQDGIVVGSNYDRWSVLNNASYKIRDNLKIRSMFNYSLSKNSGINEKNVMSRASKMPPTIRQYYEDGTPAPGELTKSFRTRLHEIYYQENENKISRINLAAELDWEIIPGLNLKPMFSFTNNEGKFHSFERYNEVVTDRPVNENHNMDLHYQFDLVLSYTKSFRNLHNLDAMIGTNYIYDNWYRLSSSGYGGTSDLIQTMNGVSPESVKSSSSFTEKRMNSYFGRINYNYDMRYLISASIRYDGSSHFAANHKFAAFPGVSAGWNIHNESFFEPARNVMNNFKIRASWGKTGYDNLTLKDTQGAYSSDNSYAGESGILNTSLPNYDLLWEETSSFDFGADLGFLENRINLTLDGYIKNTTNRLLDERLWSETGFNSIRTNFGSLNTKGLELTLGTTPVIAGDFRWDLDASFAFWRTTIGKLPNNGASKNRIGGGIIYNPELGRYVEVGGLAEGERFGARFAYQMDGVYSTDEEAALAPYDEGVSSQWLGKGKQAGDAKWRDVDGNGIINSRDMVFVGYVNPDKVGSFNNTFTYKGLTLRLVTDFSMGNVIDNKFRAEANGNARNNYATIHDVVSDDMWHKPGDIASIPRYDVESDWDKGKRNHNRPGTKTIGFNGGSNNSLYIKKGDYWAFREISLSYQLNTNWLRKIGVSGVDLTAAVYNIGYLTAYDGLTPEVIGADAGRYSRPRQFLFSIKLHL